MSQTPPPVDPTQSAGPADPPQGQPVPPPPGAPEGYAAYPPGQPYPPQQPYYAYPNYPQQPKAPSKIGLFFNWIFDFNLKGTAAQPAHQAAYGLVIMAVVAFAIARFVDVLSDVIYYFGYGEVIWGLWDLLANIVAIPLVTLAVLGIARLGFDALITLTAKKD